MNNILCLLTSNPSGGRWPEIDCCPTQAIICEIFRRDPFDPQTAIIKGALWLKYQRKINFAFHIKYQMKI